MSLTLQTRLLTRFRALPLARRIIFWAIGLLIFVYGANALFVVHYYNTISERERDSRNAKATLLAEHASRTMSAIDLSLETIAETLKTRLPLNKPSVLNQILLDKHVKRLPQVHALVVFDLDGQSLNTSRVFPPPNVNIADRRYFSEQKKWRGVGLYIDKMEISRADNKLFFAMSWPILDNDGNFQGVVVAITDPDYFAGVYGPNELEQERHRPARARGRRRTRGRRAVGRTTPQFQSRREPSRIWARKLFHRYGTCRDFRPKSS